MALTLRIAQEHDLSALAQLMNIAYRGNGAVRSWNTEAQYLEGDRTSETALKEEITSKPEAFLLIAEEDGQLPIRGSVWLEPRADGVWYLGLLTIDPTLQKSGLGSALLTLSEQWAKDRGAEVMEMHVINVRDTLIAWYERRNYRLTGESHPFPYGDNRFGRPLRADLSFVVLKKTL